MSTPTSGAISLSSIYDEYYKNSHSSQVINMAVMSTLYAISPTPNAMNEFYNKNVVRSYFSSPTRTVQELNLHIFDEVTANIKFANNSDVTVQINYDGDCNSTGGEITVTLRYSLNNGINWTDIAEMSAIGSGSDSLTGSPEILSNFGDADTLQLQVEYLKIGTNSTASVNASLVITGPSGWIIVTPIGTDTFNSDFDSSPSIS